MGPTTCEHSQRGGGGVAGARIVVFERSVRLWLHDRTTGKTLTREVTRPTEFEQASHQQRAGSFGVRRRTRHRHRAFRHGSTSDLGGARGRRRSLTGDASQNAITSRATIAARPAPIVRCRSRAIQCRSASISSVSYRVRLRLARTATNASNRRAAAASGTIYRRFACRPSKGTYRTLP
jgi:hypothetical protein